MEKSGTVGEERAISRASRRFSLVEHPSLFDIGSLEKRNRGKSLAAIFNDLRFLPGQAQNSKEPA
jgi:hypothetical protein